MRKLFVAVAVSLLGWAPVSASANGAAVVAAQQMLNNSHRSEVVSMPVTNDGFVIVSEYYRDGPQFLICDDPDYWIVSQNDHCAKKRRVEHGFWSLTGYYYEYDRVVDGLEPQGYLDQQFGTGKTLFVGVGHKTVRNSNLLVLFYKITSG